MHLDSALKKLHNRVVDQYDVIVVGAGHAGIEAALASARMGVRTACVTMRLDRIGHLPCNCSIGGPAKGHMAREVDALGGQMGITTDHTLTHIRRVGTGKGPAVQTTRAHVCKDLYPQFMQSVVKAQPNLSLIEDTVLSVRMAPDGTVAGLDLRNGQLAAPCVVLTTGTFLNGLCHEGRNQTVAARHGDQASIDLSTSLRNLGVHMRRFKTGTTPRIRFSSINFAQTHEEPSEPEAGPFSFFHDAIQPLHDLFPCWQTRTNERTHDLIRANLGESAMYGGRIEGVGPRYCPSIEDKIVRFADKDEHPIWLERETWTGEEVYVQGVSTSLPAAIQIELLRTVVGLENMEMLRPGYAVEYDMANPLQLTPHLMSKDLPGLFFAGQINGTSGYEEAAGQGIVAGINAARQAQEEPPVDVPRTASFIGVMIDDLTTKGVDDPYRMLTARAEHRLLLRHDNADVRLTPLSREIGLCDEARWAKYSHKQEAIVRGCDTLKSHFVLPIHNDQLKSLGSSSVEGRVSLYELMRRPEIRLPQIESLSPSLEIDDDPRVREQIELTALYEALIAKQQRLAEQDSRLDAMTIPSGWSFAETAGLSYESREKLARVRPATVGQAARVPGVRPTDIAVLIGHLKASRKQTQSPNTRSS